MPLVLWLVLAFVFLMGVLLVTIVIVFRHADPREPSAAAREIIEQVDRDEDG